MSGKNAKSRAGKVDDVGHRIPVSASPSNPNEVRVELRSLSTPSRSFCADGFNLDIKHAQVVMAFVQRRNDDSVRAMLEIRMSVLAFAQWVRNIQGATGDFKNHEEFHLEKFEEPEQTIAQQASMIRAIASQTDGAIDFFHAPVGSLENVAQDKQLHLLDVVSIQCNSMLVGSFMHGCNKLNERIKIKVHENV